MPNGNRLLTRLRRQAYALVALFDRPGRRWLLAGPASLWLSVTRRTPCLVRWRDGVWVHHYRGAKIPHAVLGRASPPSVFTADAREIFLYEYTPRGGDVVFDKPALYPHMTLALGHEHFSRRRFRELVRAAFPGARFGAFEAHYVPGLKRGLPLQHAVEEILERLPPFRPLLAYNFAVT
jgi:hypothetical protein